MNAGGGADMENRGEEVNICVCNSCPCWWVGELGTLCADGDTSIPHCHLLGQGNDSTAAPASILGCPGPTSALVCFLCPSPASMSSFGYSSSECCTFFMGFSVFYQAAPVSSTL